MFILPTILVQVSVKYKYYSHWSPHSNDPQFKVSYTKYVVWAHISLLCVLHLMFSRLELDSVPFIHVVHTVQQKPSTWNYLSPKPEVM
jgi:hypothetical protein